MTNIVISGTGVFTPPDAVSNEALVEAYNSFVERYNTDNADAITAGEKDALMTSTAAFIEKASGIKSRFMMDGSGAIDSEILKTPLPDCAADNNMGTPVQVQMALGAAKEAIAQAGLAPEDIDMVILSSSVWERFVPSMATEIQSILGTKGFAFDMAMGCSSATFGMSTAHDAIQSGMANKALIITSEYITPVMNYKERDAHFIFGDAAVAMVLERETEAQSKGQFRIRSRRLFTEFSTNIRASFGARTLMEQDKISDPDQLFSQNGRTVFRELLPSVIDLVESHLKQENLTVSDIRRMWLHQANINMNQFATRKLLGRDSTNDEAPIILDKYANTAGAGCIIAFHQYKDDIKSGDICLLCSFGASYSIGSFILECI